MSGSSVSFNIMLALSLLKIVFWKWIYAMSPERTLPPSTQFQQLLKQCLKRKHLAAGWLRACFFEMIRTNDSRSHGPWCIKGTNASLPRIDSSAPLMHHDTSDLGSLIWVISKERIVRMHSFGMIRVNINDPRSLWSWCIKDTDKLLTRVDYKLLSSDLGSPILIQVIPKECTVNLC